MAKKQLPRTPQKPQSVQRNAPSKSKPATTKAVGNGWEPIGWLRYALICLAITAACYIPSLSNGFVNWDDPPNFLENPNLEVLDFESLKNIFSIEKGAVIGNYNPLPVFTFYVEKWIAGDFDSTLMHGTNLLFHLLSVFFVYRLLLHMGIGMAGAFIGALLFGIHPMRVESVAWVTERKDVLFATFFFAALMVYVRWIKTEDSGKRTPLYVLMIGLAILALFSKVQAVTLPLSMLALDYWFRRKESFFKLVLEKTPFWILSLVFGLINIYTLKAQGSTNDDVTNFNIVDRLCIGAYSYCVYLYKLVLPIPMSPLYPYPKPLPMVVYLAPIAIAGIAYGVWRLWKADNRLAVFGVMFFTFNVMFLLQIVGAGQGFLADRFTYVPYFGFFAVAAGLYDRYSQNDAIKSGLNLFFGAFLVICGIWTVSQIGIWKNGETLWTHVMKYEKKTSSLPYWNRGQYLREQGQFDKAILDYDQAVAINPKDAEIYNSRGKTHFDMAMSGKYKDQAGTLVQKAVSDYTSALASEKIKPKSKSEVLINRGVAMAAQNKYEAALKDINDGLAIDSTNKNGYLNRSLVYYNMQQYDKAVADYSSYLRYDPNNANVWYERGMLMRSMNRNEEAIADLSNAIKLAPQMGLAYLERARAHAQAGNKQSATPDYQKASQLGSPGNQFDQQLMAK